VLVLIAVYDFVEEVLGSPPRVGFVGAVLRIDERFPQESLNGRGRDVTSCEEFGFNEGWPEPRLFVKRF
jgi:hypothetical protein